MMQIFKWVLTSIGLCIIFHTAEPAYGVAQNSGPSADRRAIAKAVLTSWRQRQDSTTALSFTWTSEDYSLYSRRDLIGVGRMFNGNGEPAPKISEAHETYTSGGRLAYGQGNQVRLDVHSTEEGVLDVYEVLSEDTLTVFFPEASGGYPTASIMAEGTIPTGWRYFPALPMRLIFRPFLDTAGFGGIEKANCIDTGRLFEGTRCDILAWQKQEVWVSADEHRLPVRYRRSKWDSPRLDLDIVIQYVSEARNLPVPVGWRITTFGIDGETVLKTHDVTLDEYELVEPPLSETFMFDFPHGTWVGNNVTGESYIVREGMPNRVVLDGEFNGDNYEQLLNSDVPLAPVEIATKSAVNWIWVGNGLIVAIIIALLYRRRMQA